VRNSERLVRDLSAVAADLDELLKITAGNASEAILGVRERVGECLRSAKESLGDARHLAIKETKQVARSADAYVRDNTWAAIGIAAGVGFLLGAISARSHSRRD
jgi:ElaB/YqjD/DUF883 family membrane-anchored ribosome-binding protein